MTAAGGAGERRQDGAAWPADLAALDAMHAAAERVWAAHPEVEELDRMALVLALAELVGNVIEHSDARHIWCDIVVREGAVTATLRDDGPPVPPRVDSALVPEDPLSEDGRGMAMARHLADLRYAREGGENRWVVVRPPGGPATDAR